MLINVPNEMVSSVTLNDNSLYIMFHNYPRHTLLRLGLDVVPTNYILYNQEKNVLVESVQYRNVGFTFNCSADVSIDNFTYPATYVDKSLLIWEYSQCNIKTWKSAEKIVFYMPQASPHKVLHETCEKIKIANVLDITDDIYSSEFDVLFYRSNYEYRQNFRLIANSIIKFSLKFIGTTTKMISNYYRDRNIEVSKIVLNLRSSHLTDGHFNSHRIRYLLAKAKLVITDRSGCNEDENLYVDNKAIVIGDSYHHITQLIEHFLTHRDQAHQYEMSGFIYILKDNIIDLFENNNDDDNICDNSKSFIIQLACSMEYTKELLLQKMNIQKEA